MSQQTGAILTAGLAGGITVDDMEAVEHELGSSLYRDAMIEALRNVLAFGVAVDNRTVGQRIAYNGIVTRGAVVATIDFNGLSACRNRNGDGCRFRVVVGKGITRPDVALEHTHHQFFRSHGICVQPGQVADGIVERAETRSP